MRRATFSKVAWATLGYTIGVILWGAYVRASGSGAGCGSHWPTCHGEVLPRAPTTATVIELTHRVTSGLALISVVVQLVLSRRAFAPGHLARRASGWSLFFMVTEALVGAGLVIFEKVAHDKSLARGWWMGAHLINTFMLIASMALVVFAASREGPAFARPKGRPALLLGAGLGALLLTGVSGAVAALGDTLFPADSFREGFAMDLHPEATSSCSCARCTRSSRRSRPCCCSTSGRASRARGQSPPRGEPRTRSRGSSCSRSAWAC